jgi:hypothetical protein
MNHATRIALLSALALGLSACPPSPSGGGGGVGTADDDDDDATAPPTDLEDLPCGEDRIDVWEIEVTQGDVVDVRVDTVAAATAFDPALTIKFGVMDNWGLAAFEGTADDEFDCTFPPPEFQCPEGTFTADNTGFLFIEVEIATDCTSGTGNYRFEVTGGQADLIRDDFSI